MENGLEDQLSMFQKVQGGLELHKDDLFVLPIMQVYKKDFDSYVNTILLLASKANTDITGYTVDKQAKRTDLTQKIRRLSTAAVAYAAVNDDPKLMEKCDATLSQLNAMRDNDFYTYCKLVSDEVTSILPNLAYFGVKLPEVDAATKAMETYLANIQNPRIKISERGRYIDELEESINNTSTFLREKMDKVMQVFSVINPGVYTIYMGLRGIDGTGSVKTPDYDGTVTPGGMNLVAEIGYLASRAFELRNMGETPIEFALSQTPMKMEGNITVVEKGMTVIVKSIEFTLDEAANKLYVQNRGTAAADYKVWIIE